MARSNECTSTPRHETLLLSYIHLGSGNYTFCGCWSLCSRVGKRMIESRSGAAVVGVNAWQAALVCVSPHQELLFFPGSNSANPRFLIADMASKHNTN